VTLSSSSARAAARPDARLRPLGLRTGRQPLVAGSPGIARAVDFPWYLRFAFLGILANLLLPANLLDNIGIPYDLDGGSFPTKLHPGTYLVGIGFLLYLRYQARRGVTLGHLAGRYPAIVFYVLVMLASPVYVAVMSASSGVASYIESYIPAALIAVMWHDTTARARWVLCCSLLTVFIGDAVLALFEIALHGHLLPLSPYMMIDSFTGKAVHSESQLFINRSGEFRAFAFFDHPLTGGTMTMMASFLVLGMKLPGILRDGIILLFMVALLAFGGRAALGLTVGMLGILSLRYLVTRGLTRQLSPGDAGRVFLALSVLPVILIGVLLATDIGHRILTHAYLDDSASARSTEWKILGLMSLPQLLFGINNQDMLNYVFILGLQFPFSDIENFLLLAFISLGAVWFLVFLTAFASFMRWLWRETEGAGRLMILGLLVMVMASNSLGRKSNLLTLTVSCVMAVMPLRRRSEASAVQAVTLAQVRDPAPGLMRSPMFDGRPR
jgi:hypothetical protein